MHMYIYKSGEMWIFFFALGTEKKHDNVVSTPSFN